MHRPDRWQVMASNPLVLDRNANGEGAFSQAPRRVRYTALHVGSAVVHAGALAAVALVPATWPWALGAIGANHLFNAAQSLLPRGQLLGPALVRLPPAFAVRGAVALTFDDGPDPSVTPFVLDALDEAGMRATFFCIGERVRKHPGLARDIVVRGHAVENHSFSHSPYAGLWGPRRWRRDIEAAQAAIEEATGVAPLFFRPPFGVRTPLLEPALAPLGLHCVVWSTRAFDTIARDGTRVVDRLAPGLQPGAIALLHDGIALRARRGRPVLLDALPTLLGALRRRGLHSIDLRSIAGSG